MKYTSILYSYNSFEKLCIENLTVIIHFLNNIIFWLIEQIAENTCIQFLKTVIFQLKGIVFFISRTHHMNIR